jgi:hypothetical protein
MSAVGRNRTIRGVTASVCKARLCVDPNYVKFGKVHSVNVLPVLV